MFTGTALMSFMYLGMFSHRKGQSLHDLNSECNFPISPKFENGFGIWISFVKHLGIVWGLGKLNCFGNGNILSKIETSFMTPGPN